MDPAKPPIEDQYGRSFRTLRVSLLQHCNLGCVYCVSGEDELKQANAAPIGESLQVSDLLAMIRRLHEQLGLDHVRLTGGEPLLYPELARLISGIREAGIHSIRLTTNGFLLDRQAAQLKDAGLEALNVSLDAIDEEVFFRMSRRHSAGRIIGGIDEAVRAGLDVKINSVVMKGINDAEILPLLEFAFSRGLKIRFLEIMAMGHLHDDAGRYLVSQEEILRVIASWYPHEPLPRAVGATARYWKTEEGHEFGIIANESEPFCRDCDRLRLDIKGRIYGCLSSNQPIVLGLDEDPAAWNEKLEQALSQKQTLRFVGSDLSMLSIGG
ncbi:MAG TPA: GTP 3',8-cyclase MoaA [Puia sp.]|jgi:cyclic pyranopterin phosphate synthase|nr:GTP 3',8-cyclase MoaA [Puia sp.]